MTHVIDPEPDGRGLPGGESDGLSGVVVSVARRVVSDGDSVIITGVTVLVLAAACSAVMVYIIMCYTMLYYTICSNKCYK